MKVNDYYRKQWKARLRRYCERYIKEHDEGKNTYSAFSDIRRIIKLLDGNWKEKSRSK
jgi:hypothetical protein